MSEKTMDSKTLDDTTLVPAGLAIPPGLCVAIAAPGGYAPDEAGLQRALDRFAAAGCRVKNHYDPARKHQRFGGTDEARLAQLGAAVEDPEVDLVIALRGGYGASRLLERIDFGRLAASGKRIVGHSDMTALQIPLLREGLQTFHGPMICDDFTRETLSDYTMREFWHCVLQPSHTVSATAAGNPRLAVEGTLWGGNLAMLVHLLDTPWMHVVRDGILFLEDIGEHPYRVERMLLQLLHAGVLDAQRAIVLGDMSGYKLTPYDNGYDLDAMVAYLRTRTRTPVLTGLPFGHIRDKTTLVIGADAELVSDDAGFTLAMRNYPAL